MTPEVDTTIFGSIRNAIMTNEAANTSLKQINITVTEMQELMALPHAKEAADKHYASFLNEWAVHNFGPNRNFGGTSVPSHCWIKSVKIVVTP